jgi:Ca2+-binding RTX toxin-like protein
MSPREHISHLRPKAIAAGVLSAAGLAAVLGIGATPAFAATSASIQGGTLQITGDKASDKVALFPSDPTQVIVDVGEDGTADFTFDPAMIAAVNISAGGGDDEVRISNGNALTGKPITVDGGAGDDTLIGGNGAETFIGGPGADFVDGNIGADTAQLGGGDDRFEWDPGDGSDAIDGGAGSDRLSFNGSNIGERIDVSQDDGHVRLFRDVAAIAMDADNIEALSIRTLGGTDAVHVANLKRAGVTSTDIDLAGFDGAGDAAADSVTLEGTNQADGVQVTRSNADVLVAGLPAQTRIAGAEGANDSLSLFTFGGDDDASVAPDVSDLIRSTVNLGSGE